MRTIADGSVIVTLAVSIQPLASVIITLCVPAHREFAVSKVCAEGSSHEYAYGPTPPAPEAVASPSQRPLQLALLLPEIDTTRAPGSVIAVATESEHPFASVTTKLYRPAHKLEADKLVCALGSSHKYVYGSDPPEADPVASPSHAELQVTSFELARPATKAAGSVITETALSVHPMLSITNKVYVPAHSPVAKSFV